MLKAQEWVHMRDGRGVSLAALATAAGLERRTLLRRFASATMGITPIEILGASALRQSAPAPGGRRTLAERDCPSPRLQRRGLICTSVSQVYGRGAGNLPQKVWWPRHLVSRFLSQRTVLYASSNCWFEAAPSLGTATRFRYLRPTESYVRATATVQGCGRRPQRRFHTRQQPASATGQGTKSRKVRRLPQDAAGAMGI